MTEFKYRCLTSQYDDSRARRVGKVWGGAIRGLIHAEQDLRELVQLEEKLQHRIKASEKAMSIDPDHKPQFSNTSQDLDKLQPQIASAEYALYQREVAMRPSLKKLHDLLREEPQWFMRAELANDCASRGGCCGRGCGCCAKRGSSLREKGVGHCTVECWCCDISRGFEFSAEQKEARKKDWKSMLEVEYSPYPSKLAIALICPPALPEPTGRWQRFLHRRRDVSKSNLENASWDIRNLVDGY